MDSNFDFAERLTKLETQLAERYITTEERYRTTEERYRSAEERYRTTEERYKSAEERYRTSRDVLEDFKSRLVRIETMIEDLPSANGRNHLIHVGAASLGGGGIMAVIIELVKFLTK